MSERGSLSGCSPPALGGALCSHTLATSMLVNYEAHVLQGGPMLHTDCLFFFKGKNYCEINLESRKQCRAAPWAHSVGSSCERKLLDSFPTWHDNSLRPGPRALCPSVRAVSLGVLTSWDCWAILR